MLPTAGFSDQVTAVFEVPATAAVNIWVCDGVRVTLPGVNATLTGGASDTLALADLVESATLVAVTVTRCFYRIDKRVHHKIWNLFPGGVVTLVANRSEEHTSELQSL